MRPHFLIFKYIFARIVTLNNCRNMKVAIIGAGNMGSAIASGLAQGAFISTEQIVVSNPSNGKLNALKTKFPTLQITNSNSEAATNADIIIVAVKPWLIEEVVRPLKLKRTQILVSIAAGVSFEQLAHYASSEMTLFRVIPNTAIAQKCSMTLIATRNASHEQEEVIVSIFNEMGRSIILPEGQMEAGTALASCGIAYVMKYVQAAMQAGVEMGIRPKDAMDMVAQSLEGAAKILQENETHPSLEIDKVTTPGGITIKGINELEHEGFTSAVIKAIKASK